MIEDMRFIEKEVKDGLHIGMLQHKIDDVWVDIEEGSFEKFSRFIPDLDYVEKEN